MPETAVHPLKERSLRAAERVRETVQQAVGQRIGAPSGGVLLAGSGVGALAAAAVDALALPDAARAIGRAEGGRLPPWVGPGDLVVCLGPSAAVARARALGATVVEVRAAGGGDGPGVDDRFDVAPLAAAGLVVLGHAGILPRADEEVAAAVEQLQRRSASLRQPPTAATRTARLLGRRLALVAGAGAGAVAARTWVAQLARSTKVLGVAHGFPGAAHDAVAAWGQHGDVTRQVLVALLLRHADESRSEAAQLDRYQVLLEEVVADVAVIEAEGDSPVARFADLVLLGEQVALDAALDEGLDPAPEPAVDEFRALA